MKPAVICIAPVKNEAWILEKFLRAASLWADHIIIADQNSDDGSVEIAGRFDKVTIVRNRSQEYSESERSKILIDAAREIPGPRLIVALDADEFLTPNFGSGPEWETMLASPPGTRFCMDRVNIRPGFKDYWTEEGRYTAYMDDGSDHSGRDIHSPRLPMPPGSPEAIMKDIKVMHYQYTDWLRMQSKHMWYMCWERVTHPDRSPAAIYRQYHHMYVVSPEKLRLAPAWWFEGYASQGIDMSSVTVDGNYWWDRETLGYFEQYGAGHFSSEAVWGVDWVAKATALGFDRPQRFPDPRSMFEKAAHAWLAKTQPGSMRVWMRVLDRLLSTVLTARKRPHVRNQ